MSRLRLFFAGDIVGAPGRVMLQKHLPLIKQKFGVDAVIVNGENSASDGRGITPRIMKFFKHVGVDIVTTGNHIWQKKDIYSYLTEHRDLLRPINFPNSCPGVGVTTFMVKQSLLGVINVQGRVFMRELVSCPFRAVESALTFLRSKTSLIFVDMHAETSSEKLALAYYIDGQVSAVVGTHTHVQTADERILPQGTAYITDAGMAGALNSLIGMRKEPIIHNMLTQMPVKFEVETKPPYFLKGVIIDIDTASGKAEHIERVQITDHDISAEGQVPGSIGD
jgi:metallophosphoesterase (TIGR00282 family)